MTGGADGERHGEPGKLRVVTLVDRVTVAGGAERLAVTLTQGLSPFRFDRWLIVTRPYVVSSIEAELEAAGVKVVVLDRRSKLDVFAWGEVLGLLRRERIDVIHAHMHGSNFWAAVLGRIARVPVIVAHEHTWSFTGHPLRRIVDKHVIARWSNLILSVSNEDRRRMIEIEGIPPDRIEVLPNGIAPLPAISGTLRAELGISPTSPVIGTACVLRAQKALHVLIQSTALLRSRFPDLRVLIAGDGPEEQGLRALVAQLDLEQTVRLMGRREDVPELLGALDVAVLSSDFEGSPLAVIEYMAAGLPVVATRVGGVPDLIQDGIHGLLVDAGDVEALAAAVGRLLDNPEERAAMGLRGKERQRAEFDLDVMVQRVGSIYERLVRESGRKNVAHARS